MGEILYRGYASTGSTSGAYPPDQASNLVAKPGKNCVKLTWTDPEDKTLVGGIVVRWYYTKIVRRTDRYPNDENDGVTVVLNSVRNQYQTNPYIDDGLDSEITYYYAAFACSSDEEELMNQEGVNVTVTTPTQQQMTVKINFNESDPTKMCSYADDAVGAPCGYNDEATSFWQEFFGYKPCLFKDGAVVGYLNPNDYSKFEDGSSADITSGNSGDVMIEYPRRGVKFSKSGNVVTISVTDNPDAEGYTYYAHTRGTTRKEAFYLGAYLGYVTGSKLRSLSGNTNTTGVSLNNFRTNASNLGSGYTPMTFYQYLYIQIMYCFQFANNLNSQVVLGYGKCSQPWMLCGSANTKGVVFGTPNTTGELKLFGLENPWGVCYQLLDGFYTSGSTITTATDGFNSSGSGYTNRGSIPLVNNYYFISNISGTAELGFTMTEGNGSSTTYLCDLAQIEAGGSSGYIPTVWGYHNKNTNNGVFAFDCIYEPSYGAYSGNGSRLAY